jgi:Tfp pilus assembly protein PilF
MPTKKLFVLLFSGLLISSCVGSTTQTNQTQIAQAMKKEGEILRNQGNYTAALTRLLEAEKLTPNDPYLQNSLGLAYMGKARDDLAVTSFTKALAIKPDYVEAINNLGAAYLRQGELDKAIEKFKLVLNSLVYPTPQFPLSNIGWAYLRKREFHLSEVYFTKALDKLPWFTAAAHGLAQTYLQTGKLDQAMEYLHQCLDRSPDAAIFHADLAQVYDEKGEKQQAIKSWQQVLRLVPERSTLAKIAETRLSELE